MAKIIEIPKKPANWAGEMFNFWNTLAEDLETLASPVSMSDLDKKLQKKIEEGGGSQEEDSGWQALSLVNCTEWGNADKCQIRKINHQVFIRGAVSLGTTISGGSRKAIANLPEGFRPTQRIQTLGATAETNMNNALLYMDANATQLEIRNVNTSSLSSGDYISIHCTYLAD